MSLGQGLSAEVLGKITLLQSMVTLLPDQTSKLNFVCRGLLDVTGVESVTYRLSGIQKGIEPSVEFDGVVQVFPIQYRDVVYAELIFFVADLEAFTPYKLFLLNFASMLAVNFEAEIQRHHNQRLMSKLEQLVSERTRELREKSEDLRITLQSIGDAVISTDIHGKVTNMNPVAEQLTGWPLAEALNRDLKDVFRIINNKISKTVDDPVMEVLESGKRVVLANHTLLLGRDGVGRQIADSASPIRNQKGEIRGVVIIFRDITDSYKAAEALRESEEKYRLIVEGTEDLVCRVDADGTFLYANPRAKRIFGADPEDLLGKSAFDYIHPDDLGKTKGWLEECIIKNIKQSSFENRQVNRNTNEIFHLLWTSNFSYDKNGQLLLTDSVAHDMTDRKKDEEEKARLEAQLSHAQKMESIGQLAGGVAHDYNNMLSAILGHTELAMDKIDPQVPLFADLEKIRHAAMRSADITRQLLTFARKQTANPKVINLHETVEVALKMLRRLIGEGIEIIWNPKATSSSITIDPVQVDQILANLCVNARDAIIGAGRIIIETNTHNFDEEYCSHHPEVLPGVYVSLAVIDNGHGIDKEILNRIFEPFFTTKEVGRGTGLGLATVYGIVQQNKGFIMVDSEIGCGTTFKICFPSTEELSVQITKVAARSLEGGKEVVLLVEDEPMLRNMIGEMLTRMGYNVLYASTPHDALDVATGNDYIDLLLTDVVMPEMNGYELAKQIVVKQPSVKCLFMSGYAAEMISLHGASNRVENFIQKPFSISELAVQVREALDK